MNKSFIVLAWHLFYSISLFSQNEQQQHLLESILNIDPIVELLSLRNTEDRGAIRIIDMTKKLKKTEFLFSVDSLPQGIPLQAIVIYKQPIDVNTGNERDLFIVKYKAKKKTIHLVVYLSNYNCVYKKKTRWHFKIEIEQEKGSCYVKSFSFAEWH
jgi:hypothetical protein